MKTKHRRAAHAKRKWQADPFSVYKAVARTTGFNEAEKREATSAVWSAWAALKQGHATEHDIATLTDVIAICILAAEKGDELVQQTAEAARLAMIGIADRYQRVKRWGVDATALRDIPHALHFYDDLLSLATGGQMEELLTHISNAKARIPDVRELIGAAA